MIQILVTGVEVNFEKLPSELYMVSIWTYPSPHQRTEPLVKKISMLRYLITGFESSSYEKINRKVEKTFYFQFSARIVSLAI